jgi:hypothetical protein
MTRKTPMAMSVERFMQLRRRSNSKTICSQFRKTLAECLDEINRLIVAIENHENSVRSGHREDAKLYKARDEGMK